MLCTDSTIDHQHNNKPTLKKSMKAESRRPLQPHKPHSPSTLSSVIDPLSRLESNFLQRFFKWNLVDHFHDAFIGLEQDLMDQRPKGQYLRELTSEIFVIRRGIDLRSFAKKMDLFYRINSRDLPQSFKLLHSNVGEEGGSWLREGEVVIMRVRMKTDVERIEALPLEFYQDVELCNSDFTVLPQDERERFLSHLHMGNQRRVNLFIIYFGDCNFHIFNKQSYKPKTINFLGFELQVRVFVFFVSRLGMIQKFRRLSKLGGLQGLNDLLIQLYELKRQRLLERKAGKNRHHPKRKKKRIDLVISIIKWLAFASVVGLMLAVFLAKYVFRVIMPSLSNGEW